MSKINLPIEDASLLRDLVNNALSRYDRYDSVNGKLRDLYDRLFAAERRAKQPPTKRQLWRRVARLAGEHLFEGRNYTTWRSIDRGTDIVWKLREFIKETKSSTAYFERKWQRRIAKLEAALKAWEAAP